jgi:hypothetical protein
MEKATASTWRHWIRGFRSGVHLRCLISRHCRSSGMINTRQTHERGISARTAEKGKGLLSHQRLQTGDTAFAANAPLFFIQARVSAPVIGQFVDRIPNIGRRTRLLQAGDDCQAPSETSMQDFQMRRVPPSLLPCLERTLPTGLEAKPSLPRCRGGPDDE